MEVLHVLPLRNAGGGGVVSSLLALQSSFERDPNTNPDKSRLAVLLPEASINFPWIATLRDCGVAVHFAGNSFDVVRAIARLKPSIVHAHFIEWQVPAAIGATLCRARLFFHLHSGAQASKATSVVARMKYWIMRLVVERFICVSPDISAYIRAHGVSPARIVEIHNGIDLAVFRPPTSHERNRAREAYAIADASKTAVLFFGRDAKIKGADRLSAAFERTDQPVDVLCVASSPESIEALSRNPAVHIHDLGVVNDMPTVLWAADVLALPSRIEAIPFAVLEARATGLPVVASELPGLQTFAGDPGLTRIHFESPDVIASADATAFRRSLDRAAVQGRVPISVSLSEDISMQRWVERVRALY